MLQHLPRDWRDAILLGRLLTQAGPTPVLVRDGHVTDISGLAPTTADFAAAWLDTWRSQPRLSGARDLGELESFAFTPAWAGRRAAVPRVLSPFGESTSGT